MVKESSHLLLEIEKLNYEKDELSKKLMEANEVIESIKKGNIDAVFIASNETSKILVSKTADQTYRRFIENMSEGVVTLQADGIIYYSNSSFARMVHWPLEKVIGTNFRNLIPVEHIENVERFLTDNLQNNSKLELSLIDDKGSRRHFIVSLSKLDLQNFMALNLVWTDVTAQKESEEKLIVANAHLKDANIELATFAHIASHDLQEPLRKIVTYSSLLRNDYYGDIDKKGQDHVDKIQRASERMRKLINDILEYSQLSKKDVLFKPINLKSIFNEIFSDLEIALKETKAIITIDDELPVIEANFIQMRQLFQNLISNSLKFINEGNAPEITITYKIVNGSEIKEIGENLWTEAFCIIYIQDNGIGFEPEYMDKIFTIFQRLNNNSVYPGTGVGLAICKKIVETHNGFISAESNLNNGALFIVTLPIRQLRAES